jgi:D-lactate dehydrogenase
LKFVTGIIGLCSIHIKTTMMKVLFYSTREFEKERLSAANKFAHQLTFAKEPLSTQTVALAKNYDCISIFTGDDASAPVLSKLAGQGIKFVAIRAAGYDNVDIDAANTFGITVANVPEYSPYAVAEHAVALVLALNRKIIKANENVHAYYFLVDHLVGFDLNKKTVGIIGTGRIGSVLAKIMHGFGCTILAYDVVQDQKLIARYDVHYVSLNILCSRSDIISIHTPLTKDTKYLIDNSLIKKMKKGIMIINTARGAVVKTRDIISNLENGHIGYYGMDVYENEKGVFFFDHSDRELTDPLLKKIMTFSNVLITPHQAFATVEALDNIAETSFLNIDCWKNRIRSGNELTLSNKKDHTNARIQKVSPV